MAMNHTFREAHYMLMFKDVHKSIWFRLVIGLPINQLFVETLSRSVLLLYSLKFT